MKNLVVLFLLGAGVAGFTGCKKPALPQRSDTKDLDQVLVNTPEPTRQQCQSWHQEWERLHPNGIYNAALLRPRLTLENLRTNLSFCPLSDRQIAVVRATFSPLHHRRAHQAWHQVRDIWDDPQYTWFRNYVSSNYPDLTLSPKHSGGASEIADPTNLKGVDFLWMHGNMVRELNDRLKEQGLPPFVGWKVLPRPGSTLFPMGAGNEANWSLLEEWEAVLQEDEMVQSIGTLNRYGFYLEITIHNQMHISYSQARRYNFEISPFDDFSAIPSSVLDTLQYDPQNPDAVEDYLGNSLGSAVNPVFWKLHGWIEDRLLDYLRLHPEVCFTDSVRGVAAVPAGYPRCSSGGIGSQINSGGARNSSSPMQCATGQFGATNEEAGNSNRIDISQLFVVESHEFGGVALSGRKPQALSAQQKQAVLALNRREFPVDHAARVQVDGTFVLPLSGGKKVPLDLNKVREKRRMLENIRNNVFPAVQPQ